MNSENYPIAFISPYIYRISVKGDGVEVYYKTNKYHIFGNQFDFHSTKKLTIEEVNRLISGTRDIIRIEGEFANSTLGFETIKIL